MRPPRVSILATVALAFGLLALAPFGRVAQSYEETGGDVDETAANPCQGHDRNLLRCPDLQIRRPYDMKTEHTRSGRILLRATSAIKSRGRGPIELHGRRTRSRTMRVRQSIYRVDGTRLTMPPKGHLSFYPIPGQGRYWKFVNAARFELWSVDGHGRRKRLVRTGPKLQYCFRDLVRTSRSRRTPRRRVYTGCSQRPGKRRVTLGTSVGWSDVYPYDYHEQWIDVTGLRGCFAYVHVADPENHIFESHEDNNSAQRIVRLPPSRGPGPCP
jgi:hypothetical protein